MQQTVFERNRPPASTIASSLADSVEGSFWLDDIGPRTTYPAYQGDDSVDLAIVGGGYLGLWTAILAKERDPQRSVILLEGQRVGWAASGRNGGFCEASLTHGEDNGRTRWPSEFDDLERLGMRNLDEIEAIVAGLGLDADFERNGALDVATEEYQVDEL